MMLIPLFWFLFIIIAYAYAGYTIVLLVLAGISRLIRIHDVRPEQFYEPSVTLFIPAYNEEGYIVRKMENTMSLDYPKDKLKVIWITDGSTDNSAAVLEKYTGISVYHQKERKGKIHAMNRGIKLTDTPVVIFTDANTMLNVNAIRELVQYFTNDKVGCVAGEKRIQGALLEKAVGAGEGLYWKYESFIKWLESETGSAMGAVGELFAIRRELYEEVKEDTLLDDFTISLQIARRGYHIKYSPHAWGIETASVSVMEEMKRKIRIAAGGMQTLSRMTSLLNPFRYGLLSIKYLSHKVLRWTLVPFCFPLILLTNAGILLMPGAPVFYRVFFIMQCLFYLLVLAGGFLHNVKLRFKAIFAPYYLIIMNYAVVIGLFRFILGNYTVNWQKSKRS